MARSQTLHTLTTTHTGTVQPGQRCLSIDRFPNSSAQATVELPSSQLVVVINFGILSCKTSTRRNLHVPSPSQGHLHPHFLGTQIAVDTRGRHDAIERAVGTAVTWLRSAPRGGAGSPPVLFIINERTTFLGMRLASDSRSILGPTSWADVDLSCALESLQYTQNLIFLPNLLEESERRA